MVKEPVVSGDNENKPVVQAEDGKQQNTPKMEELSIEELRAMVEKKEKIANDKHNFALSTETKLKEAENSNKELLEKLKAYEDAEKAKADKELEDKGEYATLKAKIESERDELLDKYTIEAASRKRLEDEIKELNDLMVSQALEKIPEDKREWAEELTTAYNGKSKVDMLKKIAEQFSQSQGF